MGSVHSELKRLLRKFLGKFVKAKSIATENNLTKVPYTDPEHQLADNIIAVGINTRAYMVDNELDLSPATTKKFL